MRRNTSAPLPAPARAHAHFVRLLAPASILLLAILIPGPLAADPSPEHPVLTRAADDGRSPIVRPGLMPDSQSVDVPSAENALLAGATRSTGQETWARLRSVMAGEGALDGSGSAPALGPDAPSAEPREYTLDADFDEGVMVGVNHDFPNNDQLQLDEIPSTFPFIWVAASGRNTIIKIDTIDGDILGEYHSMPDGRGGNPSRTTVDLNGAVWVGNRAEGGASGSVVRVGLLEGGGCIDRNGNGKIDTSTGLGDVRPWDNTGGKDNAGGVSTAEDECIINYVRVPPTGVRTIAVDANNDVWIGGYSNKIHVLLDGTTAQQRQQVNASCGGYGGLVDGNGVLWSSGGQALLYLDPTSRPIRHTCIDSRRRTMYGLGLNIENYVWASTFGGNTVIRYSPSGIWLSEHPTQGASSDRGVAVTPADNNVWVANSGGSDVSRLDEHGSVLAVIPVGRTPTGVAVDQAGKVWVTNLGSSTASRIDPAIDKVDLTVDLGARASPYNYSDMTGMVSRSFTTRRGTWLVVHDSDEAATPWGMITWTSLEPQGTGVNVRARSAEQVVDLGSSPWQDVKNGVPMMPIVGRYLQVEAILTTQTNGITPILYDLTVWPGTGPTPTPSPTLTPTVQPSPTPTVTPTPRPLPIYLPLLLKEKCPLYIEYADIALVIDASTSMLDPTASGQSKIDATREAINTFLGIINLPGDRAALIAFNSTAWMLHPMSGDRDSLIDSMAGIVVRQQTRTDLALELAADELERSHAARPANRQVIVLLTDGLPNPVGAAEVVAVADRIKSKDITIFTIGLGLDVNDDLLIQISTPPRGYYASPTGTDLESLYRRIARVLQCPGAIFWPDQ